MPSTYSYTLSLHDALPISRRLAGDFAKLREAQPGRPTARGVRSEEHTSELQSLRHLVCRLLLEKKKNSPYSRCFSLHNLEKNLRNARQRGTSHTHVHKTPT